MVLEKKGVGKKWKEKMEGGIDQERKGEKRKKNRKERKREGVTDKEW